MDKAIELQHELARRGHHRLPIPDLLISAAAQAAGLVVMHYDADFERIAAAGGAIESGWCRRGRSNRPTFSAAWAPLDRRYGLAARVLGSTD